EGEILAREDWFYGQRAGRSGTIPAGAYLRARKQDAQVRKASQTTAPAAAAATAPAAGPAASPTSQLTWSELGPHPIKSFAYASIPHNLGYEFDSTEPYSGNAPVSGRITAIANNPTNSQVAYAGAADGGVWKTVDDGVSWTPIFDQQPSLSIGSLAIDPNDASTLYVGTGEANLITDSYFGAGIFVTHDAGASFQKLSAV